MRGTLARIADWEDSRLFEVVAEGIPLIAQNAESLDEVARRLFSAGEHRASEIIRGFAEEEAAKVLILLDAVRCPKEHRKETLACFDNHLAKRVYALTCSYPNILTFGELRELVDRERQPHFLDGPNQVDWIFENSILTERVRAIYVDYVRDITEESGGYGWIAPSDRGAPARAYRTAESVQLCRDLCDVGADSPDGVAEIAATWRNCEPNDDTDRKALRTVIVAMLKRLEKGKHGVADASAVSRIVSSWPFPLWTLKLNNKPPAGRTLDELRKARTAAIESIAKTEAKRAPAPAISRQKVERMSRAYAEWVRECDEDDKRLGRGKYAASRIRWSNEFDRHLELPSYKKLETMLNTLKDSERAALLALAWFTRDTVANWPRVYARARAMALDVSYELGLGRDWLAGLKRWEDKPRTFSPGRTFSLDRLSSENQN